MEKQDHKGQGETKGERKRRLSIFDGQNKHGAEVGTVYPKAEGHRDQEETNQKAMRDWWSGSEKEREFAHRIISVKM
jgi:hypothetical protein